MELTREKLSTVDSPITLLRRHGWTVDAAERGRGVLAIVVTDPCGIRGESYPFRDPRGVPCDSVVEAYDAAIDERNRREEEARDRKMQWERFQSCAGHSADSTSDARPFAGPVGRNQNPMAHGGCSYIETCRCGALRTVNVNGCHSEEGGWYSGV
jgi:hypothetical protein